MPVEQSTKVCTKCGLEKSETDFSPNGKKRRGDCKPCAAAQTRRWYARQPVVERVCACGCGKTFKTRGGRDRTRYCPGHSLRSGAPVNQSRLGEASQTEIAWAAGLFEGEGYFTSVSRSKELRYAQAGINMTDEDILRRFHDVVGVGRIHGPAIRGGLKPRWTWGAGRYEDVRDVALAFAPWLGPRRLVQAVSVLGQDTRA